uniref:Protein kinase domain-containing protein n=1 Tax=Chrysotila carterae TaxID=13221 RepID=A0A7S4C2V5_CHRCT
MGVSSSCACLQGTNSRAARGQSSSASKQTRALRVDGKPSTEEIQKKKQVPLNKGALALMDLPQQSATAKEDELHSMKYLTCGEFCNIYSTMYHGKPAIVKSVKPDQEAHSLAAQDLEREVAVMSRLHHDNILRVFAIGHFSSGERFMVLEKLSSTLAAQLPRPIGQTVFWKRWRAVRAWPLSRAVRTAIGIAQALQFCHHHFWPKLRVLHRDLKPENIGIMSDSRPVLFDFGLSCVCARDGPSRQLSGFTGSLRYMSPEVALDKPYDNKAEVFSFATILYEMASHERPFEDLTAEGYVKAVCINGLRCELKSSWPAELKSLINDCWAADPVSRPAFNTVVPRLREIATSLNS